MLKFKFQKKSVIRLQCLKVLQSLNVSTSFRKKNEIVSYMSKIDERP